MIRNKINEATLLDEWTTSGKSYEDFKNTLTELSDCTEFVKVNPVEISVLSLTSVDEEKARFWELCPCFTGAPQNTPNIRALKLEKVMEKGEHKLLLDENLNGVKTLFFSNERVFFPSAKVFSRGLVQFGAGGSAMTEPNYERDLYISSLFKRVKKKGCTFVVREIAGAKKLMAILSANYGALPQSALCEIIDSFDRKDFGEVKTYAWTIDNWVSNIYVEFPEKAEEIREMYKLKDDFVPGLWLQTSDTGDASIKIFPTWRKGRAISYVDKASVKYVHNRKIELSDVIEEIKKKAFAEYTRLPEALCDLMGKTLTDETWDLSKPKFIKKNSNLMAKVIKKTFVTLNVASAIGKDNKKSLIEQMCAEFSGEIPYTAYDVASAFLSLPERLEGISKFALIKLESLVANAPYIKYVADKEDAVEEEIILV